jgi:hypothetical protein
MNNNFKVAVFTLVLLTVGCSDGENESLQASLDVQVENKRIEDVELELSKLQERMLVNENNALYALEILKEVEDIKAEVDKSSIEIDKFSRFDFSAIEMLSARVGAIEGRFKAVPRGKDGVANKKSENNKPKVKSIKGKSLRKKADDFNVFVSQINNWGGSLVAIVNIPGEGFKTLTVHSSVGNGWSISSVDVGRVVFIHATGKTKEVVL